LLKHTSISHHFKDKLLVIPTSVQFQIGFTAKARQMIMFGHRQVTEKHSPFSSQREESQNSEIERIIHH
jgi:hypothetical protein